MSLLLIWLLALATTLTSALQAHVKMGIVSANIFYGERELAWRIKIAAESLGWTAILDKTRGKELQAVADLDWVICLMPEDQHFVSHCPNYLTILHPHSYLDQERRFLPFCEKYTGYLLTLHDRESLASSLEQKGKAFHYIPFYPTVQKIPYKKVALNNLVTLIPAWGNRRTDAKYKTLYKMLSNTGSVKFFGGAKHEEIIDQGYIGSVPFDGVSVIDVLQQYGIVLVFHSAIHNREKIPSSRIFEAAAASTVIISDENAFVKEHFGDSVFYVDTRLSAEAIFDQIQAHLSAIFLDPEKALEMAKSAHDIFTLNFEMSNQLLEVEALNQKIRSGKQHE